MPSPRLGRAAWHHATPVREARWAAATLQGERAWWNWQTRRP